MDFIDQLSAAYSENASPENSLAMSKYMKDHFSFYGIKTGLRRSLLKHTLNTNKNEIKYNARKIAVALYAKPEREYHYSAIEILITNLTKNFLLEDITLIEHLLVSHSWWDTVDVIAKYLLGGYLRQYPEERENVVRLFSGSYNMWLNRSAILFQLGYKENTDAGLLFSICEKHKESKEFFIEKSYRLSTKRVWKDPRGGRTCFCYNSRIKTTQHP